MDEDPNPFDDDDLGAPKPTLPPTRRSGRRRLVVVLPALVAAVLMAVGLAGLYTDLLWYRQLGFETVFTTVLVTKVAAALAAGAIAAGVTAASFGLALRFAPAAPFPRVVRLDERTVELPDTAGLSRMLAIPVALLVGLFAALVGWGSWETFLRYWYQVPFGEADPIFGRDIAFYVFTLPLLRWLESALFALAVVNLAGAAMIYLARSGAYWRRGELVPSFERRPRAHMLGLVAVLLALLAWSAWLSIPGLLDSGDGPVAGASYTDLNARLPLLWAQAAAALLAAVLAVVSAMRRDNRPLAVGGALFVLTLLAGWLYPAIVQRFSVAPNELVKETPYIEHNIAATRKAFGLTAVDERELSGEAVLTASDVEANRATIDSIRLWDQQPLLDTFGQIQEIRTYYEFQSVDNDRYLIDGTLRQVMLSARELAVESLPNRNWINERLTFTHGYGLTLGPVTEVTAEGLPVLYVKDIPPTISDPAFRVDRPEIYFGELSSDHVFVGTDTAEFSYPAGDQNVFKSYEGVDGISIGSTWRQVLFAIRLGDLKLLLSDDMTSDSRVLLNRTIGERLRLVAPFLHFDADPYLVIHDGRLVWIADGYTVTDRYPYSQPLGQINYIRNSVKATVDAYDGTVRLYVSAPEDPIIRTYERIFPGILKPLAEMPEGLRRHLRYPEDIFRVQTTVYSTYHMSSPQVFYNKEDQWAAPLVPGAAGGTEQAMAPYYTVMRLPGEAREEFIQMLPFTPQRKDNLASWMVARSDGEGYGKLLVYRFPKQKLVYGPKQIAARINQDPEISRQLSLWNQRGSQVMFGHLMVVPIEESLIYVQPLYLRAESGKIPELRRVIVANENRIAMEETLEASLARIFGTAAPRPPDRAADGQQGTEPPPPTPPPPAASGLPGEARATYERALEAQRQGDWARYGEEIKRLGEILDRMAAVQ